MATISEALAIAVRHHQAGDLQAAEQIYQQILAVEPNLAVAWNLLGAANFQRGDYQVAIDYISRAITLDGNAAAFHNNLGNAFQAQLKCDDAVTCYRRTLELKPDHAEAHYNLGSVLQAQGKRDDAVACYRRALELKPDHAEAHNNLGNAFKEQAKREEAVACYRRALELRPKYPEAHYNLGSVLLEQGKRDDAVACYRRALKLKPDFAQAHTSLGNAAQAQGKRDEAVACYRRALELKPDHAEAHNNLGNALQEQRKWDESIACYRRALELTADHAEPYYNLGNVFRAQEKRGEAVACYRRTLELKPDHAEAHNNLGIVFREQGERDDAIACYHRALKLKPDYAEAHNNLGNVLQEQGKLEEAVACYRRASELKPDYVVAVSALVHEMQHLCQWQDLSSLSQRLIEFVDKDCENAFAAAVPPFCFLALPIMTTAQQQLRCARQWVDRELKLPGEPGGGGAYRRPARLTSKIRIGYLSADFHSHATALLTAELFEKHDRARFEIIGYSCGPDDGSPMRRRLVNAFDRFVDVKQTSSTEAAERIAADGVDILVDLKGYTTEARTQILALRPAPIQVNYLGYPGTMGAEFMDYILVDDFIVPAEQQSFFTERLVHLPGCYQVNDSQREISPRTPSRAECGLPEEGFVFCCFNNNYKITPEIFGVWMKLLKVVPGSVLWLFEGNRFAPVNLRREAQARGVAAERLVFAPRLPPAEHLARHRLADLFLDTIPYNAHTTASEALWAGCPVLTMAGETFASRVAGSLLRALDLPELITTSLDGYQETALRLARDPKQLAELRARLHANRVTSGLFDGEQFARNLEKAYTTMWEAYFAGEKPRGFRVSPT